MSDETRTPPEKLEISAVAAFPSMLLIKKRPSDMDPATKKAEMEQLQKRGSSVLQRMRNFIPQMEESEKTLQNQIRSSDNPEHLDIEHVEEGSTAVEFNLALFEHSSSDSEDSLSRLTDSDSDADEKDGGESRRLSGHAKPKISECEDVSEP